MKRLFMTACVVLAPGLAFGFGASSGTAPTASPEPASGGAMFVYLAQPDGKETKVPMFADSSATVPVAKVGDTTITLDELAKAIAGAHEKLTSDTKAGGKDFRPILDRMIDVRLLLGEAREMGLYELPEVERATAAFEGKTALEMLKARVTRGIGPESLEVEQRYRDATQEWKVKSVLFPSQADAAALVAKVRAGGSFDELTKKLVSDKKAKGGDAAEFLPRAQMLPPIVAALKPLKKGEVSAPVKVPNGFAVLRVEDTRFGEDPKARAEAEAASRGRRQKEALQKYYDSLVKQYATVDKPLLKRVDFEAKKPGFKALLKDHRVVAKIRGAKPITVADIAKALDEQFYHGVDGAIREKKVNRQKEHTLEALLSQRLAPLEAKKQGIYETADYRKAVADFTDSAVFTAFVQKAILPDVKVSDEDIAMYYSQHSKEYMFPAFYKVESIGFAKTKDAEAALKKLRSGTDYKWLKLNVPGQLKEGEGDVHFDGGTVAASAMPKDLAKQLESSKAGDYRLYSSSSGQAHVIHVVAATPPAPQALNDVKDVIQQKVYGEHVTQAMRSWAEKLRKARPVTVYITKIGA